MSRYPLALFLAASSLALLGQTPSAKSPAPPPSQIATEGVLTDGTPVRLRLINLSAPGAMRVGDTLELEVVDEVRVRNVVVIPAGAIATAVVTNPQSAVSGHGGEIDVNSLGVALSDGKKVALRGRKERRANLTVVASSSGQDLSMSRQAEITAYIDGDSTLDLVKIQAANRPTLQVKIASRPSSAEVSIDGRAVGTTPFVLHLPAGNHAVALRQAGYQPWQQNLRVVAEPVNLDVTLVKQDGLESIPPAKPAPMSLGEAARAARARKAAEQPSPGDSNGSGATSPQSQASPPNQAPPQN